MHNGSHSISLSRWVLRKSRWLSPCITHLFHFHRRFMQSQYSCRVQYYNKRKIFSLELKQELTTIVWFINMKNRDLMDSEGYTCISDYDYISNNGLNFLDFIYAFISSGASHILFYLRFWIFFEKYGI